MLQKILQYKGVQIWQTEAVFCTTILLRKFCEFQLQVRIACVFPSLPSKILEHLMIGKIVCRASYKSVSHPHIIFYKKLYVQQTGASPTACRNILQGSIPKRLHHTRHEPHTHLSVYWNKHERHGLLHHSYSFIHWWYGPQFMIWIWFCFNYMQVEL